MRKLSRLLIANRGEIVLRIARTARAMGIETVAVYSDADGADTHAAACDKAIGIGGKTAPESYLVIEKIIAAARESGADAVHPGYGFLSENAAFAQAVADAGLVFVGPPPAAISTMGDKAAARQRMAKTGIPVVPGYDGDEQSEARFLEEAKRIGFPVMIKASAGGGGRGMRKVASEKDFVPELRAASSEAKKAFGDGRLILERAVERPRHVEIQVFADNHGNVVHLGERDCSVQRRHQKVLEEAPSPVVDAKLREKMGAAATAVAREIGYAGAGTVEFLLDREGNFYFMEMNTRLQVEHPVTEMITGLDLVEWQLRVARAELLPKKQSEIGIKGHAIEARLCAEDPAKGFLPRTGKVLHWRAAGDARFEVMLREDMEISPFYDSMLGKVIAWGETRNEALEKLADALERSSLLGVTTNRGFLVKLLRHPAFRTGIDVSTAFIPEHFPDDESRKDKAAEDVWMLAALLADRRDAQAPADPAWNGWSNAAPLPRVWWLSHDGELRRGIISSSSGSTTIATNNASMTFDAVQDEVAHAWNDNELWLQAGGVDYRFERETYRQPARKREEDSDGISRAPLNAKVSQVSVAAGDTVAAGQSLMVLEAMKMEHHILARTGGKVKSIAVNAGDQVVPGQMLAEIEIAMAAPSVARH
ncbi:MAG: ATP-grasp domain-containing protein [Xanthobacteraceae bacterium]|nr:ATP-grasp domain-containing protein [Xanthobacteraceae bacterium]QYK46209.1 MAG: ATP-grasp domain-containing protein [Xanthobacteraceae bacterium]